MDFKIIPPSKNISLLVKNIWVFENEDKQRYTSLPFFADGHPGLMFQQTDNGLVVQPNNKRMPVLFLYGQTIHPVELEIEGAYKLIVFQFYPFVPKSIFGIDPVQIHDDCFDLTELKNISIKALNKMLLSTSSLQEKIDKLSELVFALLQSKKGNIDLRICSVIQMIIATKGQENIVDIYRQLNLNKRTIERRFLAETGISPKQFASMVQFQSSMQQITAKDFKKLTDIVYENGYTDQSHFIKVFKFFAGKTPKQFKR